MQPPSTLMLQAGAPARPRPASGGKLTDATTDLMVAVLIVGFPVAFAVQVLLGLEENLLTVAIRAVTVGLSVAVLALRGPRFTRTTGLAMAALVAFAAMYGKTMVDVLLVEEQDSLASPTVMFGLFLGIGIIPSFVILLCQVGYDEGGRRMRSVLRVLLLLNTLFLAVALFNGRDLLGTDFGRFKVEGGINQIYMGHMGVLNLYVVFFLAVLERATLSLATKGFMAGAVIISCVMIILAGSRGPFVALYVTLLYIVVSRIRRTSGIMLGILGISSMAAFVMLVDPYQFREWTGSSLLIRIFEDEDFADEARLTTYQIAWENFMAHPLVGRELLVFGTYPHNFLLEILMATGLSGMALFLVMYLRALKECLAACFGGRLTFFHVFLVHTSVMFMFSGAVWGMHMLWTALALVLVIHARQVQARRRPRPVKLRSRPEEMRC